MSGMKQERGRERYGSTNLVGKAGRKEEQHANHGERGHEEGGRKRRRAKAKPARNQAAPTTGISQQKRRDLTGWMERR